MKLLVTKEKAIQILQDRISELHKYNFNPEAWKERTVLDLKEIFPSGSSQYIKIQFLNFNTFVTLEKTKVFNETKKNAEDILKSYISFIEEYSRVAEEREIIKEKNFEEKYFELLEERNQIVRDCNNMISDYDKSIDERSILINENEDLKEQIQKIKDETIQIDNVSFKKLTQAFFNLPILQIVSAFSIIIAIIIGVFQLATVFEKNSNNATIFDLKTELHKKNEDFLKAEEIIKNNQIEIENLKTKINNNQSKK